MCSVTDATPSPSYLTPPDFVAAVAPEGDFGKISREQYALLFKVADRRKCGRVNFEDFVAFEEILKKPAAEYDVRRPGHANSPVARLLTWAS